MTTRDRNVQPLRAGIAKQPQFPPTHSAVATKAKVPIHFSALEVKRKLSAQLDKDKNEKYMVLLSQLLTGDLPKHDFDKQIKILLTEEQRKLHNLFVITILRGAYGSIATTNTQRRSVKVVPLVPRLGTSSRELTKQPMWTKIRAKMLTHAKTQGLAVDPEAVNAVLLGLEHHIKSVMSVAEPSNRLQKKLFISPVVNQLARLESKEVMDTTKKGDLTANNITFGLSIVPNGFTRKGLCFDDDINQYHLHNYFAHVHLVNKEVLKLEREFLEEEEEIKSELNEMKMEY